MEKPKFHCQEFHDYLSKAIDISLSDDDDIDIDDIHKYLRLATNLVDNYDYQLREVYLKKKEEKFKNGNKDI
jgi:hypothetical protein